MVFLIQKSQNKDSMAMQLKLNELLASNELASNRIVDVEDLTEDEIRTLQKFYKNLSQKTKKEMNLQASHSIEEGEKNHQNKLEHYKKKRTVKK